MTMLRQYYFSKFIGNGTEAEPFRPSVSFYTPKWGMIDCRKDETRMEGWCFASADSIDHSPIEQDPNILCLGIDPHSPLDESLRERLKELLQIPFVSASLADILTELLLDRQSFKPTSGKYQIHLGGLIRELTEEEALAFVGRIILSKEPTKSFPLSREPLSSLLPEALDIISSVVGRDWLEREIVALGSNSSTHPLLENAKLARQVLTADEQAIHASHAVRWIISLARDLSVARNTIMRIADRLRNSKDCEPTKYELRALAAYVRAGDVQLTDTGKSGEFKIRKSGGSVHVECKYKYENSARDRRIHERFTKGIDELKTIMEKNGVFADVRIVFRSDPSETDVTEVTRVVEKFLPNFCNGIHLRKDGCKIELLPFTSSWPKTPRGFDVAAAEGRVEEVRSDGKPIMGKLWSVAWRSLEPTGWLKSALGSLKQAARQLPEGGPGLIYLQLSSGPEETVVGKMAFLTPRIRQWLGKNKRINAVILTVESPVTFVEGTMSFVRTKYRNNVIQNPDARTALPDGFRILLI